MFAQKYRQTGFFDGRCFDSEQIQQATVRLPQSHLHDGFMVPVGECQHNLIVDEFVDQGVFPIVSAKSAKSKGPIQQTDNPSR